MKKLLFSVLISFALNVGLSFSILILNFFNIDTGMNAFFVDLPFYISIWIFELFFDPLTFNGIPTTRYALFFMFFVYSVNTLIYTLPVYGIWVLISRIKQKKIVPTEEPPPPPVF